MVMIRKRPFSLLFRIEEHLFYGIWDIYTREKDYLNPQYCNMVFSEISTSSTPQEAKTEIKYIETLLFPSVYITQS